VIVQTEVHDRLELLTAALTSSRTGWEKVPGMQPTYNPVVKRIQFPGRMMVLFNFLSKCIAPL
jgi:hypothetical protein